MSESESGESERGPHIKRSRRIVLTLMGSAAIGAVSMGFVRRIDCGPDAIPVRIRLPGGRVVYECAVTEGGFGGFGGGLYGFHGHGHGHGG
ncbi:MAG: hypothetical protein ACLP8B_01015 [Xanthobacteraceae bacterium]